MDLDARGLVDMQSYVEHLEANNLLVRVKTEVDPIKELAGVAKKFEGDKVVLFENVKGSDYPVIGGLYWNREVLGSILGCKGSEVSLTLLEELEAWSKNPVEPEIVESGPANEVTMAIGDEVDLDKLPIPHLSVGDGGRYICSSAVIVKDPDNGMRNLSIHRMLVKGKNRVSVLLEETGDLRDFQKRAEARGEALECTISNGIDYPVHIGSATPGAAADETGLISQMRGVPVQLMKGKTVDVESIANAQFILEGKFLPNVRETEGPFAEFTGYYATAAERWVIEITAITRRENPIFHTIIPGKELKSYGLLAGGSVFKKIKSLVPEVTAMHFQDGLYHLILQMNKKHQGRERDAIMVAFASLVYIKTVTVVDEDVDIYDPEDIDWAVQTRCRYEQDFLFIPESIGHDMNPVTVNDKWTRLGIDATKPIGAGEEYVRAGVVDVDISKYEIEGG